MIDISIQRVEVLMNLSVIIVFWRQIKGENLIFFSFGIFCSVSFCLSTKKYLLYYMFMVT
jgi:hypothetical protein